MYRFWDDFLTSSPDWSGLNWLDAIIRLDLHGFRLIGVDLGGLAGIGRTHDANAS